MATYTANAAQANVPAIMSVNRTITRTSRFAQSVSYTAADIIQMMKVPIGAIVHSVQVSCSLSAGVVTVNIGDGNDTSAYGAGVVLSGAGVQAVQVMNFRGYGRSYSAEDTIDLVVVSTSTPAANAELVLTISYSLQN